ncbi:hypothetical protein [Bacillus altitudinis]|uniref:hypothetical protein n=1 Tax=Bacillus altitudinis TaxID=293387 RepID=UPI00227E0B46|nr:hypothetical protein [Bacillus altitudinis]MCY7453756.1 hypothetical protein [Bacillus altitudinis]MCY7530699.1 hypothetical protein [Bacillus altitudinis]
MNIQALKETIQELKEKELELENIKEKQIEILKKKAEKFKEIIMLYKSEEIVFENPNLLHMFYTGPVLGIEKITNRAFIYDVDTESVILLGEDEPLDKKEETSWWHLIKIDQFENAIAGFDHLLDIPKNDLANVKETIEELKASIEELEN